MPYTPKHKENPHLLREQEIVPAKIWELLRHNEEFHRVVSELQQLDKLVQADKIIGKAWFDADAYLKNLKSQHDFGGYALEWLVPEPHFVVRKKILSKKEVEQGQPEFSIETIEEGSGITPNPEVPNGWSWVKRIPGQPQVGGGAMRRGPEVVWTTTPDSQLQEQLCPFNPIAEWKEYSEKHGSFSLKHSWAETPPQFKRTFCWLWRLRDNRATTMDGKQKYYDVLEHESRFFQGWDPWKDLSEGIRTLPLLTRFFEFDRLAKLFRVFAVPKSIRSRTEARRIANWMYQQLIVGLPEREPESFGTPRQWDIFLQVRDEMNQGDPLDAALQESFEKLYLNVKKTTKGGSPPQQDIAWGQSGAAWTGDYRFMNSPSKNTGLIQSIFPSSLLIKIPTNSPTDT